MKVELKLVAPVIRIVTAEIVNFTITFLARVREQYTSLQSYIIHVM